MAEHRLLSQLRTESTLEHETKKVRWDAGFWVLWNLGIAVVVVPVIYALLFVANSLVVQEPLELTALVVSFVWSGGPAVALLLWLYRCGAIGAAYALGLRKPIMMRLLLAVVPSFIALAAEGLFMVAYILSLAWVYAFLARLPK